MNAYETILNEKLVAIVRGFAPETVVEMAKAYVANGIRCIEVTFDQSSAEKRLETVATIKAIKAVLSDQVCVGAGTVMSRYRWQLRPARSI